MTSSISFHLLIRHILSFSRADSALIFKFYLLYIVLFAGEGFLLGSFKNIFIILHNCQSQ
jgi:hypothetical protein